MKLKQYDEVRLRTLRLPPEELNDEFNLRPPKIGDVATIIEIYTTPPGFELECSDANGITQWLMAFHPEDVELEFIA